ncbi:hypothetical protein FE257_004336 [Aspergillus nanangensis]|uniref:Uncharacterized protein n=1 Tax=Aspergillus nanangensis TaxID=2582783 RepID=A0AAD4CBX7_ASPNN|nr:hypothetical protein FE257_004336 [Aspergillus nanangensis]
MSIKWQLPIWETKAQIKIATGVVRTVNLQWADLEELRRRGDDEELPQQKPCC